MGDVGAEQRVLTRLGLARLAIADQLVLVLKRFRAAQLRDLEAALAALPDAVVAHVEAHFDRKLDVKDELERYAQDLLKATHLARHLQLDGAVQREVETLVAALGDGGDRALLLKMLQALGARLARVLCAFCVQLPHIKLQQDFYRVFAGTDPGVGELKPWMQWLESVPSPAREGVDEFLIKATREHCLAQWLTLLAPLSAPQRVAVIQRLAKADASLLKQIGRFHEVTALPVTRLLELCDTFRAELALVLAEFPMATTLTLYAKFNNDRLIATVIRAMYLLGKGEVIRLVDALAVEDNLRAIQAFFISMIEYERNRSVSSLYLRLSKLSQSRLVELALRAASGGEDQEEGDPSIVFHFVLEGQLRSMDDALRKLTSLPAEKATTLMKAMQRYSVDELVFLGEGIEVISDLRCLDRFFRLFDMLLPEQRTLLVDWVHDVPGEEAVLLYDKLFQFHSSAALDKVASLLQMMSSLKKSDKITLCVRLLQVPSQDQGKSPIEATNDGVLKYLCDCELSRRHKSIKLLDATDHTAFDTLLFLLRTQRMPEQVALTKVMLSLSPDANGRLLAKLQGLDGETLDEFFQLLMLIPKIEYNKLARLLVSQEVSLDQFQTFVHVAANMMNQAASREIVIFTSDLPPRYRNMFFETLAQCTPAEKGVVMRIVACSSRLSSDVLHLFVELQLRIPWETRSALVEQLRALEESADIQTYVLVLRGFDEDACLPRMVHLLNLLPLPVRISLVPLFARIDSIPERVQALGKLNAMRKDRMPPYCTALCAPLCLHIISCTYMRVFGYLQDEYQNGMLQLLEWKSCWVFIEVLAAAMDTAIASSSSADSISANTTLVNGLAASLTLLKLEDDFVLLGDVMEEAMENGTRLEELIVVFAYFRDRERLLALLKYVSHLTRYSRSTLFFRVLSRSKVTAFLFDMCHVLDLDDALFALKRLDRMCLRDGPGVEKMLSQMAQVGAAVDSRDEFCHLVLGYRERSSTYPATPSHVADRVVEPRMQAHDNLFRQVPTRASSSLLERLQDGDDRFDIDVASVSPASLRPIAVIKQLERVQDKRELARHRRRCRNWREWTLADWRDVMVAKGEDAANDPQAPSVAAGNSLKQADKEGTERRGGGEDPATLHDEVGHGVFEAVSTSTNVVQDLSEACPDASKRDQRAGTVLPPIARPTQAIDDSKRPPSGHNNRPLSASTANPDTTRTLTRSESAPVTLDQKTRSDGKKYRGLQAALGLDEADVQHSQRGRGASIFHSQCKLVIGQGPSRIRAAHTEEAHAKVLAARVDHALGRRADTSSFVMPVETSLRRSERRAIDRAAQAISLSKRDRSRGAQDFLKRGSYE